MIKVVTYEDLKRGRATCEFCGAKVSQTSVVETIDIGTFASPDQRLRLATCPACEKQPEFVSDR
jgi:hypothetical protein